MRISLGNLLKAITKLLMMNKFVIVRDNNVVLFQSPPYSMHNVGARTLKGNDAFEGYAIDLIEAVARVLSKFF